MTEPKQEVIQQKDLFQEARMALRKIYPMTEAEMNEPYEVQLFLDELAIYVSEAKDAMIPDYRAANLLEAVALAVLLSAREEELQGVSFRIETDGGEIPEGHKDEYDVFVFGVTSGSRQINIPYPFLRKDTLLKLSEKSIEVVDREEHTRTGEKNEEVRKEKAIRALNLISRLAVSMGTDNLKELVFSILEETEVGEIGELVEQCAGAYRDEQKMKELAEKLLENREQ